MIFFPKRYSIFSKIFNHRYNFFVTYNFIRYSYRFTTNLIASRSNSSQYSRKLFYVKRITNKSGISTIWFITSSQYHDNKLLWKFCLITHFWSPASLPYVVYRDHSVIMLGDVLRRIKAVLKRRSDKLTLDVIRNCGEIYSFLSISAKYV